MKCVHCIIYFQYLCEYQIYSIRKTSDCFNEQSWESLGYDALKCFETLPCRANVSRDHTTCSSFQRVELEGTSIVKIKETNISFEIIHSANYVYNVTAK